MRGRLLVLVLGFAVAGCKPPSADEWERLHRELVPAPSEAWESVGWRLDLDAARLEATSKGRPLFFWAMNGHPCGCT